MRVDARIRMNSSIRKVNETFEVEELPDAELLGVQLPDDLSPLKEKGGESEARCAIRAVFEELISDGYEVVDFVSAYGSGNNQNKYVLEKSRKPV